MRDLGISLTFFPSNLIEIALSTFLSPVFGGKEKVDGAV
jgi:hypothetical protein